MAYNLQSLIHAIHQILLPHPQLDYVETEKEELEYLLERATTLQQILENIPLPIYQTLKALQIEVIQESQAAEDIVDSWLWYPFPDKKVKVSLLQQELQKANRNFDSLVIKALDIKYPAPASSFGMVSSFVPDQDTRDTVVGLDEDIRQLQDRLTGYERELTFIPIVGMGGIGKTTLAKKLYVDPLIVSHFDCVAWATVSQDYDVKAILSTLLSCSGVPASNFIDKEVHDVGQALYKKLFDGRYLIVLDDVWDTNVLDRIRAFFPDRNNQSRIMLTTRELDVANYVNSSSPHHQMRLLDEVESWNLFHEKLLCKEEGLDTELAGLGRIIANSCKGLPLAITVISGLLSGSNQTKAFWKSVADDIRTTLSRVDEQFSKIFSLSYDHLPHHLRPCLLYIGAFPRGTEVRVSRMKRLWAAENFLKPIGNKTLEEAAEEYLEGLANRNLMLVSKWKSSGKVKSYDIHDFVRDQCIRKADEEKFVVCVKYGNLLNGQSQSLIRRVLVFNDESFFTDREGYQARDSEELLHDNVRQLLRTSKLIKVLDAPTMYLPAFPEELLNLVNIRYLWLHCNSFPFPISRLYNLETLIFCPGISIPIGSSSKSDRSRRIGTPDNFHIPYELWKLRKLRHFKLIRVVGWVNFDDVMEKLQTLSGVRVRVTDLIGNVPNIRKLALYDSSFNLSGLDKLESLKISSVYLFSDTILFPPSITKLTLFSCSLHDTLMKGISDLPCLQVLKLRSCYVYNHYAWDWVTHEDGFPSLQFLEFDIEYLVQWITEDTHFPRLRHLVIRDCLGLEEIPSCIGDIPTLEIMEIDGCSAGVVASARQILEEQCNVGNDSLQVRIRRRGGSWEVDDHP